jgi:hypothetical protein
MHNLRFDTVYLYLWTEFVIFLFSYEIEIQTYRKWRMQKEVGQKEQFNMVNLVRVRENDFVFILSINFLLLKTFLGEKTTFF